ncbi:putative serine esterase-domain-containing protein [Yarrowia lipolytica]|uniref:Putative serine esterase-domain-containing protein n=1 Tax=Yarrowia lipolytica TaxID=4952 RepID=A0A371C989_YARLL|nr:Putative lipase [Yarrowia lipolytica]RDW26853.1 putative serine esterase-domain-containing protein [Yarrowia lipolytica]RDW33117.1 putative serine esterase-domain-containing protein [Yarrowia lipolytica]RDW41128.1 putative serine esterase-domain-containing protein [Yarrowia lipolytica]RDW48832.1 putative serine esterase-domain-containing protein [Yarrowia lipolytica]
MHLFVLIHGLWGSATHMAAVKEVLDTTYGVKAGGDMVAYATQSNHGTLTYDGVQVCARRCYLEIKEVIRRYADDEGVTFDRISILGYSLGGLIARYLCGIFLDEGFFDKVKPVLFSTIATPHLGSKFHRTDKRWFSWMNTLGSTYLGNTGRDLFLKDPTLADMSNPSSSAYKALEMFDNRVLLANCRNDRTVHFPTAFITAANPFANLRWLDLKFHEVKLQEPVVDSYGWSHSPRIIDFKRTTKRSLPYPVYHEHIRQKLIFWSFAATVGPLAITAVLIASMFFTNNSNHRVSKFLREGDKALMGEILESIKMETFDEEWLNEGDERKVGGKGEKTENTDKQSSPVSKTDASKVEEEADVMAAGITEAAVEDVILGDDLNNTDTPALSETKVVGLGEAMEAARHTGDRGLLANWANNAPFSEDVLSMIENMDKLGWEKYAVYITVIHSHAAIVARRGLTQQGQGAATLRLFSEIIRSKI